MHINKKKRKEKEREKKVGYLYIKKKIQAEMFIPYFQTIKTCFTLDHFQFEKKKKDSC